MSALPAYSDLMLQVAPILGYDPSSADRRGVARYRSRGSLKIDFDRGTFADFEAGIAGGVLDFIQHATGEDACTWLERQGLASLGSYPFRARGVRETADLGAQFRELSDEKRASADLARATFEQALPIDAAPEVAEYLAARGGLDVTECGSELRYSPSTVWEDERRKCLLVRYRNLINDEITGIVRILIDEPECWPKTQRKMLGVVRLAAAKLAPVTNTLAVAEGVETALAANMLGYGPAWALGSAGAIASLPVLPSIERLFLLTENNEASRQGTDRCSQRWLRAGRDVITVVPDHGDDLNDELMLTKVSANG